MSDASHLSPTVWAMTALVVFLKPAVQHVGIHAVLQGKRSNGGTRAKAGCYQVNLELSAVRAVRTAHRLRGNMRVFEHRVHASYVHTIISSQRGLFKMDSPDGYS